MFASLTVRRPSAFRSLLTRSGVASRSWSCPKAGSRLLLRPFLGWSLRVACPQGEPRTASGRPTLPAPLPVVRLGPRPSSSPSGGDRFFRHLPPFGGGDFRPDHKFNLTRSAESHQAKNGPRGLWITWISGVTRDSAPGAPPIVAMARVAIMIGGSGSKPAELPFRSHMPSSKLCPTPRRLQPNPPISPA